MGDFETIMGSSSKQDLLELAGIQSLFLEVDKKTSIGFSVPYDL